MKMVIGGAYQGKTDYAKQVYPNLVWSDGASCDLKENQKGSGGNRERGFRLQKTLQKRRQLWQSRFYRKILS